MNVNRSSGPGARVFLGLVTAAAMVAVSFCPAAAGAELGGSGTQFYLVGMGPGDADLVTPRAIRVIEKADVVYVSPGVAERFAELLEGKQVIEGYWRLFPYYGADPDDLPPEEQEAYRRVTTKRNEFIRQVRRAVAEGKTVAVADSGDPLIYGPWAWSLEEFADLDPVVAPGLSCFNAANAALACSITSGNHTRSVVLTANDWPGMTDTIQELSKLRATMVLFTMKADVEQFIAKLRAVWPPETPVAIVQYAGYAEKQSVIEGTLGGMLNQVDGQELPFEYLVYVGDFLRHRKKK